MKTVGNSSRGRSQGVPKIFRSPMYMAHCAVNTVIFAIAQLSCCTCHCFVVLAVISYLGHVEPFYDDDDDDD